MITQNSNNKPSGYVGRECDAATPIAGKTDSNIYQTLRLNTDGTLPIVNYTGGTIISSPIFVTTAVGALGANTYISNASLGFLMAGVYKINPTFVYAGTLAGGISFVLYQDFSTLATYINGLSQGNTFSPGLNDLNNGLYGYWHNTVAENFGAGLSIAYNRNNTLEVFLGSGNYNFAMISEGTVTISASGAQFGCFEVSKLG
jgi:hypothetical protein